MLHSPNRSDLGSGLALIFKAIVDAFRGQPSTSGRKCSSSGIHYGAWR